MSHADLITLPRLLSRLPRLLVDLPAIVKGQSQPWRLPRQPGQLYRVGGS